jgi:nucleoid-associated protein YgaU
VLRSASLVAAAISLLAVNVLDAQQVEVVPRDTTVQATDTTPWVPADTVVNEVRHVVKRGDTLWDLARQYLKDPFRWPDVFRRKVYQPRPDA